MFAAENESFLIKDEPEHNAFEFADLCYATGCMLTNDSKFALESISLLVLVELKPLSDSLKYSFLGPNESLPFIIASDLDWDQEDKLIALLRENDEAIGWTLGISRVLVPPLCSIESI